MPIQDRVNALVEELLPRVASTPAAQRPTALLGVLLPYIREALADDTAGAVPASTGDRRAKTWLCVVRFWRRDELLAESEPFTIQGTGTIPQLIRDYAAQVHGCGIDALPAQLDFAALKDMLPQMRNNLGRYASTTLRVPYVLDGEHVCQVDVSHISE